MNEHINAKPLSAYYSKQEVAEKFSLAELLSFARQGDLQKWFEENFYDGDAVKLAMILKRAPTDADLKLFICEAFDLPLETLSPTDADDLAQAADTLNKKLMLAEDRMSRLVETQGELVKALRDGANRIYLCGGEFRIPLTRNGVTYLGRENAVVDIDAEEDVDLDAREIVLEDLQVYLRRPIALRAENSRNLKILDGSKKSLQSDVSPKEILSVLRGRGKFESPEDFKQRAEKICGAAVGVALFDEKDYDFDAAQFKFRPQWDFSYISVLKDFADENFSVKLAPEDAERLCANERKLKIFADFTCLGDKPAIARLYFAAETLGIIAIENAAQEKISSTESFTGSSSIFGLGYGLEIITDYGDYYELTETEKPEPIEDPFIQQLLDMPFVPHSVKMIIQSSIDTPVRRELIEKLRGKR